MSTRVVSVVMKKRLIFFCSGMSSRDAPPLNHQIMRGCIDWSSHGGGYFPTREVFFLKNISK